jgi:hypothetical protein
MSRGFGKGIQLIEQDDGSVELTYVEHSRAVFASPVIQRYNFPNWNAAVNFIKCWETLGHIQWWDEPKVLTAPLVPMD